MSRFAENHHRNWASMPSAAFRAFWSLRPLYRRIGYVLLLIIFVASWNLGGLPMPWSHSKKVAASVQSAGPRTATASGDCTNVTGTGTVAWGTPGNAYSNSDSGASATAALGRSVTSNWLRCMNFGFTTAMIPTGSSIVGIIATINRQVSTSNSTTTDAGVRLVIGGTIQTTDRKTATAWPTSFTSEDHGGSTDLWGSTPSVSDVTGSTFGVAISAVHGSTTNSTFTFSVDYVQLTIYFNPPYVASVLTQRHYIFQQDSASNVNSNANNGSADTALTGVNKGERLNARFQIDNTAGSGGDYSGQLDLFYDRNDGIWTKVRKGVAIDPASGNCTSSSFNCTSVDTTGSVGTYTAVASSPAGQAWVSYYDVTNADLKVAQYVGSGGTGCASSAWSCTSVDTTGNVGQYTAIAFSLSGQAWVSYYDSTNADLKVAQYVGSGGTGCASSAWSCTSIDTTGSIGQYTSIAFDTNGSPWISYYDVSNQDLKVAQYVGSGGTGCASSAWSCTSVHTANGVGQYSSIAFTPSGQAWVSYYDSWTGNTGLDVAQYVGSGGTGCASSAWSCVRVITGSLGQNSSIAIDGGGVAWISYTTGNNLSVAQYVGTGGSGCTSSAWSCTSVDTGGTSANNTAIALDNTGKPWVSYAYDSGSAARSRLAQYVGSGGSGCTSSAWTCTTVDSSADVGRYASVLVSQTGQILISYYSTAGADLKVAMLNRGGEIVPAYGLSGSSSDALTSAVAGSCQAGTTFANGNWDAGNSTANLSLAAGKCTELSFLIDTSQATPGITYRLSLRDKTNNKSLAGYSAYPTFSMVSSGQDTLHASKDNQYQMPSCTDINWGCKDVFTGASTAPYENSSTIDANGNMWVSSFDNWVGDFYVSHFVGSGGSGCTAGITDWSCEKVEHDSAGNIGEYSSIGVNSAGEIWVSYYQRNSGDLRVAKYVGTGGTGCLGTGVTDWTCTTVDSPNDVGGYTSIAFDPAGNPWVTYFGNLHLRYAKYVGSGGNCTSTAWSCDYIDTTGAAGRYTSIKFNSQGTAFVTYTDQTANWIDIAQYVGWGGTGCTGSTAWTCTIIDQPADALGQDLTGLTIGSDDSMWVAYRDMTALDLWVAKYVGSGGTGCTNSTIAGAWSCTKIDATNSQGNNLSIASDASNNPWISYYDATATALKVAQFVGGGAGSGCGGGSSDWYCTTVDNQGTDTGSWTSISFDASGTPWIAETDKTASPWSLKIAKLKYPPTPTSLRYKLDNLGYTSLTSFDANLDQMAATTNVPTFAFDVVHANNSTNLTPTWVGKSNVAASSDNIKVQVYRYGTTNAWVDMATNSSCAANADCTITPTAITANLSEYHQAYGSSYLVHYRVLQLAGSSQTLQTNYFAETPPVTGPTLDQLLRGGAWVVNGVKNAFSF